MVLHFSEIDRELMVVLALGREELHQLSVSLEQFEMWSIIKYSFYTIKVDMQKLQSQLPVIFQTCQLGDFTGIFFYYK